MGGPRCVILANIIVCVCAPVCRQIDVCIFSYSYLQLFKSEKNLLRSFIKIILGQDFFFSNVSVTLTIRVNSGMNFLLDIELIFNEPQFVQSY